MKLVRKRHPYFPFGIIRLEKWLSKMALSGLKLQSVNGWNFIFISSEPKERKYFCYSGFAKEKGISYDYFRAKELYSVRKSPLNKSTYDVFEVDLQRIDEKYDRYVEQRNRYYKNHYGKLLCFWIFMFVLSVVSCLIEKILLPMLFIVTVPCLI